MNVVDLVILMISDGLSELENMADLLKLVIWFTW